jgi:hypothetical protein
LAYFSLLPVERIGDGVAINRGKLFQLKRKLEGKTLLQLNFKGGPMVPAQFPSLPDQTPYRELKAQIPIAIGGKFRF